MEVRECRNKGRQTIVQQWGRVLVPPQGICLAIWYTSLSSPTGAGVPTQVEDGNFRLSTSTGTPDWLEQEGWWLRFLEHHPLTSPPTNQKKVTHPAALTPNLSLKTLPWNSLGSSGLLSMSHSFSLVGPAINLSLLQTPTFQFLWFHGASGTWTWVQQQNS